MSSCDGFVNMPLSGKSASPGMRNGDIANDANSFCV